MSNRTSILRNWILWVWLFAATSAAEASLRYDGLYLHHDAGSPYTMYLRFYSDGTAMFIASTGTPEQVVRWFHRGPQAPSSGNYTVHGEHIRFTTLGFESRSDCVGSIQDASLTIRCDGSDTAHRFDFLPMRLTK